jgi:hypothetical protein
MAISIKPSHKGMLHRDLGVAKDKPIPASKLAKAKNSSSPAVRKRDTFAENAKHWNHKGAGKKSDGSARKMPSSWHSKFNKTFGK